MTEAEGSASYITVNDKDLYGIINENGEEIVKNEYLYIEYAFDNHFIAYKDGKGFGVIDKDGNILVDFEYDVLSKIGEYKLLKGIDMEKNTTDVFSKDMKKIASLKSAMLDIHDNYIEIYNSNSANFITTLGEIKDVKEVLKDNKLFAIFKDGKWGFEDREGNTKVDYKYDYVTEFNNYGFAGVCKGEKWGVINENGEEVCECKFKFDYEEEVIRPNFIGKYYKTYGENNEIYYSDEM